ncbi:hypothetical protein F2P56_018264 [Juglans regia]|uniref:Uncharacterized protein LOC108982207 n=2 Tax=Juglans regia TaxID=51240 RepID=A0A2I4DPI8_JUGRE|nr:uncharacterized protein LOC108982207 [Juglans regia]XP_018809061.1 uncharacterized protein LOC108982207 [Juglans regia]XP_018809062.1 uncharacterized protein LOC108982207 [Juglans regia]KAF5462241.1 hypothetical protein F2P56_018264 [Juglans regia]
MGKREGTKKAPSLPPGFHNSISLREEVNGRKQVKGGSNNSRSMLKLDQLQKLAAWTSGQAAIPSLGAFFGHRLATVREAMGVLPDPSLFSCERCETILQPGFNCTVRIEKNKAKAKRRRKKTNNFMQNNVVYKCLFCSHCNMRRGTPKGYMKEICPSKAKASSKSEPAKSRPQKRASLEKGTRSKDGINKTNEVASPAYPREVPTTDSPITPLARTATASPAYLREVPTTDSPITPLARTATTLLEAKRRKRNLSMSKKLAGPENNFTPTDAEKTVSTSNKRRRKSWTSLKEIAEASEHDSSRKFTNLTIPFGI